MLILTIKTNQPTAEVGLYEDERRLSYETWEAHRQLSATLLLKIQELLNKTKKEWADIQGVIYFKGPGSFTGLRIGASVANALAFNDQRQLVGSNGKMWIEEGLNRLLTGQNDRTAIPEYGSDPRTTKPRK